MKTARSASESVHVARKSGVVLITATLFLARDLFDVNNGIRLKEKPRIGS